MNCAINKSFFHEQQVAKRKKETDFLTQFFSRSEINLNSNAQPYRHIIVILKLNITLAQNEHFYKYDRPTEWCRDHLFL